MTSNRPEFVVAINGISKIGAAAVLLSPAWKAVETRHALELTGPVHAVADGPATELLVELHGRRPGHRPRPTKPTADVTGGDRPTGVTTGGTGEDDEAVLVFSSGTTGLPKAVRHTHRSIGCATAPLVRDARPRPGRPVPGGHAPLAHPRTAEPAGGGVGRRHRAPAPAVRPRRGAAPRSRRERMTLEMAVAPIALAMANHPNLERFDLSSLRYIMWGATPVSEHVARTVTERSGVRWLPAYGASEVPVIAVNPVGDPGSWRLDSAGLPPEGVELRVADLDTGAVLAPGETGEIQVLSPSVMAGYLPEEETAAAFSDGWYRTGDVGWLEAGRWVHLTDRSKEMIKVNGFQVAPAEIEGVLLGHPAVLDCAVFGLVDERSGEVPVAAVLLDPEQTATAAELEAMVAGSLATYKQLRHVVFVDTIPRLPSGKALRRTLRDEWTPVLLASARERMMDVRLSPEQLALAPLGRPGRRPARARHGPGARRRRAGRQARRRRGRLGLARAPGTGGRTLAARLRGGGGGRRRGARPGTGRCTLPRPDAGGRAPAAGRCTAGRDRRGRRLHPIALRAGRGRRRQGSRRRRGRRCPGRARRPWCCCPKAGATCWPRSPVPPAAGGTDLTRPGSAVDPGSTVIPVEGPGHPAAHGRRPVGVDRARAGSDLCRSGRDHARGCRPRRRLRLGPVSVRPADRLVPGRPAPVGRRLRVDGGIAQRRPLRGLGGRRARRPTPRWPRAAGSKAYCARAARTVCETAIQVHGGIGNTWECLAHVHLRRALLSTDVLGGVGPNLDRVVVHHGIGADHGLR